MRCESDSHHSDEGCEGCGSEGSHASADSNGALFLKAILEGLRVPFEEILDGFLVFQLLFKSFRIFFYFFGLLRLALQFLSSLHLRGTIVSPI